MVATGDGKIVVTYYDFRNDTNTTAFEGTDYFALALNRTFRRFPTVTWATDRPDGFRDVDIAKLEDINPALAAIFEPRAIRRGTESLRKKFIRTLLLVAGIIGLSTLGVVAAAVLTFH